jgi:hypothetical protein
MQPTSVIGVSGCVLDCAVGCVGVVCGGVCALVCAKAVADITTPAAIALNAWRILMEVSFSLLNAVGLSITGLALVRFLLGKRTAALSIRASPSGTVDSIVSPFRGGCS